MTTILHIASSSNLYTSVTRQIGAVMVDGLIQAYPGARVIKRDLVATPIPHVSPDVVGAMFGAAIDPAVLALSDELVSELLAGDIVVIEAPMYNFGIPSALKAWIDHVVRAGKTFQFVPTGSEGLVTGKRAIIVLGRGGIYSAGPLQEFDHQESYLRAILGFIGFTQVDAIQIEGVAFGPEQAALAIETATLRAGEIIAAR
jgi:FMN-dependent NADH-azoreductase